MTDRDVEGERRQISRFFLFFSLFFLLPRSIPPSSGRQWSKLEWKQPQSMVPLDSWQSSYRSAGGLVRTARYHSIFYSLIDLKLFGAQNNDSMDTVSMVADLKRQHTSWNHVEGTHWHTRFSHLINYGAGKHVALFNVYIQVQLLSRFFMQ
ncbi:hypothetical protein B296_00003952 [Ensete ventricosum]|uniref:Uncharacterized protein n=1 Tax=Ensete ventricosum TaxID=4639 RepID=A0A426ZWY3_ENSVE|nr:hypothetical protein B296_00003952 [Ensete ventricosum]